MRRGCALVLFLSAFVLPLAAASGADASKVIAPPGNSGVSQYVEVVPGAGGSTPAGTHTSHGPVLTPAQRHRLEAAGPSGKALAGFVQQTGVARSKSDSARAGHDLAASGAGSAGGSRSGAPRSAGASPTLAPASSARASTPLGGGLGWGLPAALGAIMAAAAGIALARRRAA